MSLLEKILILGVVIQCTNLEFPREGHISTGSTLDFLSEGSGKATLKDRILNLSRKSRPEINQHPWIITISNLTLTYVMSLTLPTMIDNFYSCSQSFVGRE